jgi:hypothetical protein
MLEKAVPVEVVSELDIEEFAERYVRAERPVDPPNRTTMLKTHRGPSIRR